MIRASVILIKTLLISLIFCNFAIAVESMNVFVSIVPQKYFVEQIGKERVSVQVMVPPGASPETYEPKPRQMADLLKTRVYFAVGVQFENTWLDKIAAINRNMEVVQTDHGIEKIHMDAHTHYDNEANEHHETGDHEAGSELKRIAVPSDHNGRDPHIWLAPPLVKIQARAILTALKKVDPVHNTVYEANYRQFIAKIDSLDAKLRELFQAHQGLQFMVFHPSWGYFAHTYGLKQVAIELEGKNPKPGDLKALIEHAREKEIRVVFVQPQFSSKSAELIAREIGGRVAIADPLAEDWEVNLHAVAESFKTALK